MRNIAEAVAMHPSQLCRITQGAAGAMRVTTVARVAAELGMELRLVPIEGQGKGAAGDPRAA